MKILLVGNYIHDQQESMLRFARLLITSLTRAGHEVRICRPFPFFGLLRPAGHGVGKWLGYIDKFALFPPMLMEAIKWADVVHLCDQGNAIYIKYLKSVPHVVTCHDLLSVRSAMGEIRENRISWTGRQLQRIIRSGLSHAQHIVCVSNATRRDLLRLTSIPTSRVSCAYSTLNYAYSRMGTQEAQARIRRLGLGPSESFLLHVGGNQWYKNRIGVLNIFTLIHNIPRRQKLKLVMVGKSWTAEMRRFVASRGLSNIVVELTDVVDEDLRALYSTATMMLFPSLQEGFGWPIVEAQACGCPVITSNRSPMDEVGGDAAVYVDPDDPESAALVVSRSLERAPCMREASMLNATRFSESSMIDGYLFAYDKVRAETRTKKSMEGSESRSPRTDESPRSSGVGIARSECETDAVRERLI